jgi:uncharacterized HAD superfamily protein
VRIGVDIDGLLADWNLGWAILLEQQTGRTVPRTPPLQWAWPEALGFTKENISNAWKFVNQYPDWWVSLDNEPIFDEEARVNLVDLCSINDVYFITNRMTRGAKAATDLWLRNRGLHSGCICTKDKGITARGLDLHYFLDDKPENCLDVKLMQSSCEVFIMDQPWNTGFTSTAQRRIERIYGWEGFFDKVGGRLVC